ncbi:MAG: hypothetical protein OEX08_01305 [Candidatus Nomurabacteria bacterium]|nr:hypothetical protein [Candidatus Nomurabacteria bacterium]
MKKLLVYILYIVIMSASFLAAYYLPVSAIIKNIATVPGIISIILVLYKSWKDEMLQNKQQDFILGTASHMAEVAYNKHVKFCEEYIERIEKARQELFRVGPTKKSIEIGRDLVNIRQRHSPWLTKDIERGLKPFEGVLIEMGAKEGLLNSGALPIGEKRARVVEKVYKSFGLVLGHDEALTEEEAEVSIDMVIEKIRDVLGINTLTKLRLRAVDLALERLRK